MSSDDIKIEINMLPLPEAGVREMLDAAHRAAMRGHPEENGLLDRRQARANAAFRNYNDALRSATRDVLDEARREFWFGEHPTVSRSRRLARVDPKAAVWVWLVTWARHNHRKVDPALSVYRWPLGLGEHAPICAGNDCEAIVDELRRNPRWLPTVERMLRPFRVAMGAGPYMRTGPEALQVAWDRCEPHRGQPLEHPFPHLALSFGQLLKLTDWLSRIEKGWTPLNVWAHPCARLLLEQRNLEKLQ